MIGYDMPSKTNRQKRFMRAVSHNAEFAKKVGVPQKVGKEFEAADKAKDKKKTPIHEKLFGKSKK